MRQFICCCAARSARGACQTLSGPLPRSGSPARSARGAATAAPQGGSENGPQLRQRGAAASRQRAELRLATLTADQSLTRVPGHRKKTDVRSSRLSSQQNCTARRAPHKRSEAPCQNFQPRTRCQTLSGPLPRCRLITYWPARSMLTHFRREEIRDAHRPSTAAKRQPRARSARRGYCRPIFNDIIFNDIFLNVKMGRNVRQRTRISLVFVAVIPDPRAARSLRPYVSLLSFRYHPSNWFGNPCGVDND